MKILLRFDDICPTMKWSIWKDIESILIEHNIKPILAVIPDNKDKELIVENENPHFWGSVKKWQKMGWTIGLHGFQHTYVNKHSGIIQLNNYSEFAGLSYAEQYAKITAGVSLFNQNGITPQLWIAPAHSFDQTTIEVLKKCGITCISDGFFLRPGNRDGIFWVPQQVWSMTKIPFPYGTWTVCYHINNWDKQNVALFRKHIITYQKHIMSMEDILNRYQSRKITTSDVFFKHLWHTKVKLENIKDIFKWKK